MGDATGEEIRVGVIDSGWDRSIVDTRVREGRGVMAVRGRVDPLFTLDDHDRNGHGTTTSDIVLQIAPNACIFPIRVLDENLRATPGALLSAISCAVDADVQVLNLSLCVYKTQLLPQLYELCVWATERRVVIVAAAAPDGVSGYPAVFEPVIGVAADSSICDPFAICYRPGAAIECSARAWQWARTLGGRMDRFYGASVAAPVVTGHIAALLSQHPEYTVSDVRTHLAHLGADVVKRQSRERSGDPSERPSRQRR
jgi:subtilisin family serine protease